MAGAGADTAGVIRQILYDEKFRLQLETARREFLGRFQIQSDGRAAERGAAAVLDLVTASNVDRGR